MTINDNILIIYSDDVHDDADDDGDDDGNDEDDEDNDDNDFRMLQDLRLNFRSSFSNGGASSFDRLTQEIHRPFLDGTASAQVSASSFLDFTFEECIVF